MGGPGTGQVGARQIGARQVCTSRFGTCQVRTGQEMTSQGGQICTGQNSQSTGDSSVALLSPTCFSCFSLTADIVIGWMSSTICCLPRFLRL